VAFVVDAVRFLNDHETVVTDTAQITGSQRCPLIGMNVHIYRALGPSR
jgi:hypothetical protein